MNKLVIIHLVAHSKRSLSSLFFLSQSINLDPASNCIIIPDVTIGEIPNSIKVPLLEANIALSQYKGSEAPDLYIPYNGICEHIRYMKRAIAVHKNLSFLST